MTADVRVVPMKTMMMEPPATSKKQEKAEATAATAEEEALIPALPPHSPPVSPPSSSPRSLSLTRAALLIDQLPISDGYIGNQYGFANDCLSSMSPSCNPFSGTGFYRPGFVGERGFFFDFFFFFERRESERRRASTVSHALASFFSTKNHITPQAGSAGRWAPGTRRGTLLARASRAAPLLLISRGPSLLLRSRLHLLRLPP